MAPVAADDDDDASYGMPAVVDNGRLGEGGSASTLVDSKMRFGKWQSELWLKNGIRKGMTRSRSRSRSRRAVARTRGYSARADRVISKLKTLQTHQRQRTRDDQATG